jgi:hypothetical protein
VSVPLPSSSITVVKKEKQAGPRTAPLP